MKDDIICYVSVRFSVCGWNVYSAGTDSFLRNKKTMFRFSWILQWLKLYLEFPRWAPVPNSSAGTGFYRKNTILHYFIIENLNQCGIRDSAEYRNASIALRTTLNHLSFHICETVQLIFADWLLKRIWNSRG